MIDLDDRAITATSVTPSVKRKPSDKSAAFALSLGKELRTLVRDDLDRSMLLDALVAHYLRVADDQVPLSKWIEGAKATRDEWRAEDRRESRAQATAPKVGQVDGPPEGMHKIGDVIYKVQVAVHGSGRKYAKRLHVTDEFGPRATVTFEFEPGAIYRLSAETMMSLDEAKEFGALYGACCVCGRTLTDEKSIEAGIGPVCAKGF